MVTEGQTVRAIDPTLKLSDERLREVLAWLCGERWTFSASACEVGSEVPIAEPSPDELASIANDLISTRTALDITNETCRELEEQLTSTFERARRDRDVASARDHMHSILSPRESCR